MSQPDVNFCRTNMTVSPVCSLYYEPGAWQSTPGTRFSRCTFAEMADRDMATFHLGQNQQSVAYKRTVEQFIQLVNWNNSVMYSMLEKNYILEENIKRLQEEIQQYKQIKQKTEGPKMYQTCLLRCRPLTNDPSHKGDAFVMNMFGDRVYKYALAAIKSIPKQLYKERNFNMTFKLVDSNKNLVLNCKKYNKLGNPIPVSLCLFESAEPNNMIEYSKSGKPIFKGNSQATIYHGRCEFRKIYIRQVTSYYPNGWIYGVLSPKEPPFSYNLKESSAEECVDWKLIRPLVVSHISIRAKKK